MGRTKRRKATLTVMNGPYGSETQMEVQTNWVRISQERDSGRGIDVVGLEPLAMEKLIGLH